jgi:outer membrane protein OmpA-like peptidoglycan-associated protein
VIKRLTFFSLILFLLPISVPNSQAVEGTPVGAPLMVKTVDVAPAGGGTSDIDVTWSLEATGANGGSTILGFSATVFTGAPGYTTATSATCSVPTETAVTCKITGLSYGATYEVGVTASNAVGTSPIRKSAPFTTSSQSQTVTFKVGTRTTASYGDPDFQVEATASSNLAITWSSTTTAVCSIDASGIVHILTSGTCTIKATQTGVGSSYAAAFATTDIAVGTSVTATIRSASSVLGSSAVLNGDVPFPGTNVSPVFCYSTINDSSTCTNTLTPSPSTITATSGTVISARATGLTAATTYYFWISISGGTTKSSIATFTTLSGPTLTQSGSPTCEVGKDCSVLISATGGSGTYTTWSASEVPAGLTFTSGITESTISGTPTANSTLAVTVTVTDSDLSVSRTVVNFVITTPNSGGGGGSGGGGSPTPTPVTPAGPSSQTITVSNTTTSVYYGDPDMQLIASASSGLPIAYVTTSPAICSISTSGLIKFLAIGQCLITLSQSGNTSFSATSKSISIEVLPKLSVVLEEFTNVQSSSATAVATAPWPGSDATIKFCVSLTNSKKDCTAPTGIDISTATPTLITKDSGSVVTSDISGLAPGTDYFVWAVETLGAQSATSEIRKIHTPVGPTILYSGSINYTNSEPIRVQFRATGGSGGYKNWKADGLPTGAVQSPSTGTFTVTGNNLKSGTYIVTVTVQDKSGSPGSITIVLTITGGVTSGQPTPVQGATTQLASATSVEITWNKQNDAVQYVATLGTQTLCTTSTTSCVVPQLLGPKSQITVTAVGTNGVKSQAVPTLYKAPVAAIDLTVVNFALNSAVLDAKSKAKIATWAKTLQAQGFTALQVSGHTDSTGNNKINTPLSKARATNTFKYLKQILAKTPISVTLLAEGASSPVQSNKTAEGRAANRRAVVSIR